MGKTPEQPQQPHGRAAGTVRSSAELSKATADFFQTTILRVLHDAGEPLTIGEIEHRVARFLDDWADAPVRDQVDSLVASKLLDSEHKRYRLTDDGERVVEVTGAVAG